MDQKHVDKVIEKAQLMCAHSGTQLTEKRKKILGTLAQSKRPLSAYEAIDNYNKSSGSTMPPMSAYRILDFLESENLVHKLSSTNKYVACSHITCEHSHETPLFLICSQCQSCKEISLSKKTITELGEQASSVGFMVEDSHLEIMCVCSDCRKAKA